MRRAASALAALAVSLGLGVIASPVHAASCTPGPGAACAGADLQGLDLRGRDLSGADFNGANLSRTNLAGANLRGASIKGALVEHADLRVADLTGALLNGSQFDFSDFAGADLDGADAASADFAMTRLNDVSAREGNFHFANFYGAAVHRTDFSSADVRHSSFHGADFAGTHFSGARITGTQVTPSNIGDHPKVRDVFFDRVHTHINAYGNSDNRCDNDSADHDEQTTCNGPNDDPNATTGLTHRATFHWGRVDGDSRPFWIKGSAHDGTVKIELHGSANPGLGAFDVRTVSGPAAAVGYTPDHAHRGQVGGPLAMNVSHKAPQPMQGPRDGMATAPGGYALTLIGWLQHGGTAAR